MTYLGADAEGDGVSERSQSGRSSRSRRRERGQDSKGHGKGRKKEERGREKAHRAGSPETQRKGVFEPLHKPEAYRGQMSSGPMNVYSTPDGAIQGMQGTMPGAPGVGYTVPSGGQSVGPGMMSGPYGAGPSVPGMSSMPSGGVPMPQGMGTGMAGPGGFGPHVAAGSSPTRGPGGEFVAGPSFYPGGQPQSGILKHPGLQATSGPPGLSPQGYMIPPGYNIPPNPGAGVGASAQGVGPGTSAYGATQTGGRGGGAQQAAAPPGFEPLPTHPLGPSVALGQTPGVQPGGSAFTAPAQALAYNSGRVFLPAYPTSPSRPTGRVYYSKGSGGGGGGGDGGPPHSGPAFYDTQGRDRSPDPNVRFMHMEPLAQGTPITGHSMPRTGANNANMPSPIRKLLLLINIL